MESRACLELATTKQVSYFSYRGSDDGKKTISLFGDTPVSSPFGFQSDSPADTTAIFGGSGNKEPQLFGLGKPKDDGEDNPQKNNAGIFGGTSTGLFSLENNGPSLFSKSKNEQEEEKNRNAKIIYFFRRY